MRGMVQMFVWMCVLLLAGAARGAITARLAEGTGNGWELMSVEFGASADAREVCIQDARGGLTVVRGVPAGVQKTWMVMPLVAPGQLAGGSWVVEISLRQGGREVERSEVALKLEEGKRRRIVASEPWVMGEDAAVVVPAEEIVNGPAMLFAGCEDVCVSRQVLAGISRERALALLATGVRLMTPQAGSAGIAEGPPGGELGGFVWGLTARGGRTYWTMPAEGVRRPTVLQGGLETVAKPGALVGVPAGIKVALLLVGPAAVVVLVLARGLFRRRVNVAIAAGVGMMCLGAGVAWRVHAAGLNDEVAARWGEIRVAGGGEGVMLEEAWHVAGSSMGGNLRGEGGIVLPAAASVRGYWGMTGFSMLLKENGTVLTGKLPGGARVVYQVRKARDVGLMPGGVEKEGEWAAALKVKREGMLVLKDGYVTVSGRPVLFTEWVRERAWADSAAAWWEMRYEAGHAYLVVEREGGMEVVDFGGMD